MYRYAIENYNSILKVLRNTVIRIGERAAGQEAGEQMINVGNKYAEKVLNVQPTLTIRSGYRANIIIDKDIILESYQNNVEYIFN